MSNNIIYCLIFYYAILTKGIILVSSSIAQAQNISLPSERSNFTRSVALIPKPKSNPFTNNRMIFSDSSFYNVNILSDKLKAGFDALGKKQIERVIALRDEMPSRSLDRNTLTWAIVTSDITEIPSSQFRKAMIELKNWPGEVIMRRNFERALARENNSPQEIINFFSNKKPLTADGMAILGAALIENGQDTRAHAVISPWWHTARLDEREEQLIINKIGQILTIDDHRTRLKTMLYAHKLNSAARIARLAEATSPYEGISSVIRNDADAWQKLSAVDEIWKKQPIYTFARIQYLRHVGQYEEAVRLMLNVPNDPISLTDPDAWWMERRVLSREMLDIGQPKLAYHLAAMHSAKSPVMVVDAEFHAGWYALRFLNNPRVAMKHFSRIIKFSSHPISKARGFYWMGRASEAMHEHNKACIFFQRAAYYGTTFYGQLASSRLGEKKLEITYPRPTAEDRKRFESRDPVKAIKRLESASYIKEAILLYRELSNQLETPGELALLAIMAERRNDYHTSLKIGKYAVQRGFSVGLLSHPLGAIPASADISAVGKTLAYAIARQESEFNPTALSRAGARGILQLLPGTAKGIASRKNLPFSIQKLSNNPGYNAMLGAYFLAEQLEKFNKSCVLAFIGYNTGSRRVGEWIIRYGDPRGRPIDEVVDWIERIPYTETRNYVQRVMENYEIYKIRMTGESNIKADLVDGCLY